MPLKSHFIYVYSRLSRLIYEMSDSCIFCKIVSNEVNANIVYRDEQVTAFRDLHPVAPTHILIVPNKHIDSVGTLEPEDEQIIGHIFTVARKLADEEGISGGGFRMITNTGAHGGQTVFHLHVHLIGGQRMKYPMG
jgi:histidine triad (HIT) family protein